MKHLDKTGQANICERLVYILTSQTKSMPAEDFVSKTLYVECTGGGVRKCYSIQRFTCKFIYLLLDT